MAKEYLNDLDLALASEARAMCARLFDDEDRNKIGTLSSTDELIVFLRRTEGWDSAAKMLAPDDTSAEEFSLEMERRLYGDLERLYRFAQPASRDFLALLALRIKSRSILAALRRLASPAATVYTSPLPPLISGRADFNFKGIADAKTFDELILAVGKPYGDTLLSAAMDPHTGLPNFADTDTILEKRYFSEIKNFIINSYIGNDKDRLLACIGFHADLRNISYLLRLRKFKTSPGKARELLIPISSSLSVEEENEILAAPSDEEAVALIIAGMPGLRLKKLVNPDPEKLIQTAEHIYFRSIIHGPLTLSTVFAYLVLKEAECDMLKRVFVALQYGMNPKIYI